MKYIFTFFLVVAMALTTCSVTAHAAETETQTVNREMVQETVAEPAEESGNDIIYYVVFIGSALLGSLVALGLFITFKS